MTTANPYEFIGLAAEREAKAVSECEKEKMIPSLKNCIFFFNGFVLFAHNERTRVEREIQCELSDESLSLQ